MTALEIQSVPATLDKMKMLFWRLDLNRRSFANLNECVCGVLGLENYRFFKDRKYRERILHPEDLVSMDRTFSNIKDRVMVRTVFRVQSGVAIHWYKLTGWPTSDHRYYEGAVEEITEHISRLKDVFEHEDRRLLETSDAGYPVAIFYASDKKLLSANKGFQDLFGINFSSNKNYQFKDLVRSETSLPVLMESFLTERHLEADLLLALKDNVSSRSSCLFKYFTHGGEGYIRFAVVDQLSHQTMIAQPPQRQEVNSLCRELTDCQSIDEMLTQVYESRSLFSGADVVMFSDVYARKNKVIVYSKGKLIKPIEPGSQFPYAGTIAENIEKEKLEYLIVEDTQTSIKAIDWMVFVPNGIRSYIAKALYVRGAMRTILVFCSREKSMFNEEYVAEISDIATAFHNQLKVIRKRSKPSSG